jgi:hypothetical protein
VEVVVFDPERGKLSLHSRVLDMGQDLLTVSWPEEQLQVKYFFESVRYAVLQAVVGHEVVALKVNVTKDMIDAHATNRMVFKLPRFMDKLLQNRVFHRVEKEIPVKFRVESSEDSSFSDELFVGDTSDISIGGLEFSSMECIEPGSQIELFFTLEYVDFCGVQAEVLRRTESTEHGNLEYKYSVKFTAMFEWDRTTLSHILMKDTPGKPVAKVVIE